MTEAQVVLELLIANLFGDESKLGMMGEDIVTEDTVPEDWKWHRAVIRGFYEAERVGDPPTPENIALLSRLKGADTLDKLKKIAERSGSHSVRSCAIFFKGWADNKRADEILAKIGSMSGIEYGDVKEKYGLALDALLASAPMESKQSYTRISMINELETIQARRVDLLEKGQALGAQWHLAKLRELAPVMRGGDVTLLTAAPKAGKTTSVMQVAEYNAEHNDTDVLILLLETPASTLEERFLAKYLMIPPNALRKGLVDLRKDPFRQLHSDYKERQQNTWDTGGRIYIQYIAGAKLSKIAAEIRTHKRMADARNRPLLVIIDYLQRIPEIGGKSTVESLAIVSNSMKDFAVMYGVHILLLSQESFTGNAKAQGDSRAHGSNTPIFVAQVHMALRVLNSQQDIFVGNGDQLDRMGNVRYFQRKGNHQRQSILRYDIIRANDDETGNAYMLMENPLFTMYDFSAELDKLDVFFQKQVNSFEDDLQNPNRRLI